MTSMQKPKLMFSYPFDERTAYEAENRGYWGHSFVEFYDGRTQPVVFYDLIRLAQDLEEETNQGRPFVAEQNMIIVQSVTLSNMTIAIEQLVENGFFD